MKIAIIRGPYLNRFEMQNYEPLAKRHKALAFYTNNNFFPIKDIKLPKKELKTLESILGPRSADYLRIPIHFPWGYYHHMLGLVKELEGFEIAHGVETFMAHSLQLIQAKKKYGLKVVLTCWENIPFAHQNLLFFPWIKRLVRQNTDLFLAVTERAKTALILEGIEEERILVVPMGIDLKQFKPRPQDRQLLKKLNLLPQDFVMLFVGRLTREKGILELILAHSLLVRELKQPPILLIVGEGPLQKKINRLIKKLGTKNFVRFGSCFSYKEISKVYNLADIFVLPSLPTPGWQEQFGMVLVEAMASGVPVVSTLSGSIPEVVEDAGILVQPADPLSLYQAFKSLSENKSLGTRLIQKGLRRAKLFDREKVALKLEKAYERILNS